MFSGSIPSFSNYAYTELWRSDIDDIGQAVLIASTAVESYTDNAGSAAKLLGKGSSHGQGVKGDFNASARHKGKQPNPDYVKQFTATKWQITQLMPLSGSSTYGR